MTDAIEIALISDNNDQLNSVAVWDIRNGTTLMQYRGKIYCHFDLALILTFKGFQLTLCLNLRWRSRWKAHSGLD